MRARRIATVIQWVRDPESSAKWYSRVLGVTPTPYAAPYFRFEAGDAYLILAPAKPGTGRGGTGAWFLVDSVDDVYRRLTAEGFRFNEEPFDIPPGRLVTLNDPDGNIIGFIDDSKGGMPEARP